MTIETPALNSSSSLSSGPGQTNSPIPLRISFSLSNPLPLRPTGGPGLIHLVHPDRYSRAIPIDSMPSPLTVLAIDLTDVLAKCGIATVRFTLQYLPHALILGINRVTGMPKPTELATLPILGEKLETRVDLAGRSSESSFWSRSSMAEPRYLSVAILFTG